mmetsp:Transcript_6268/g.19784  ORF Transcript_6268/g.19784 Transcript_6268/m.19784 type:complete len:246 (+) Transcript_6268:157-894(+)
MDLGFSGDNQTMGNNAIQALEMITGMQEQMIDAEIHKLDNLKGDDLAKIREERMRSMKDRKAEEAEWSRNGHGHLTHLTDTKDFFAASKNSKRLVCHFMRPTSHHCVALNGHLAKLASLHRETRFCTFDAEKSPYLCDKILADPDGNVVIPTVLLVKEGKVSYHVRGLAEFGGEMCNCEIMAAVLQIHEMIEGEAAKHEYEDDKPKFGSVEEYRQHQIREGFFDQGLGEDDDFSDDEYTGSAMDA